MKTREKPKTDAAPAIGDRLLTLREAAEVLRLSPRTVREYVQRGEIEGASREKTGAALIHPKPKGDTLTVKFPAQSEIRSAELLFFGPRASAR